VARRRTAAGRRRQTRVQTWLTRTALCELGGVSPQQLAVWEYEELLAPERVGEIEGRSEPLYDRQALRRVRLIRSLAEDLEVNLPGIGIILELLDRGSR